jgi:hypothetical protein
MPIYKITVDETVTRECIAYVDAPDHASADQWSGTAPDSVFKVVKENEPSSEVSKIERVDDIPADWPRKAISKCARW